MASPDFDLNKEYARASAKDKRTFAEYSKAALCAQNGQFDKAKDLYRNVFVEASLQFEIRFHTFEGFTSILRQNEAQPSAEDFAFLKRVAKNEIKTKEASLYQIEALFTLGLIEWDRGDRTTAGRRYRKGIEIRNAMTNADLDAKVPWHEPGKQALARCRVALIVDASVKTMTANLRILEGGTSSPSGANQSWRLQGGVMMGQDATSEDSALAQALTSSLEVPGSQCAQCKISREEAPSKLMVCGKCRRVYFCSAACQRIHWKEGHKQECRLPKDFRRGDIVRLFGLKSAQELNGQMVRVLGSAEKDGRWRTAMLGEIVKEVSIHQDNMEVIKPIALAAV